MTDEEKTSDASNEDSTPKEPAPEAVPPEAAAPEAAPSEEGEPEAPASPLALAAGVPRLGVPVGAAELTPDIAPSFGFLAVVSLVSLIADLSTKVWAKERLEAFPGYVTVWEKHVSFILAHNKGGAWGLLQSTNENVRKPFFLLVSAAAIAFIVTLFRRLQPNQRALKWGLPLVLGGALGNVFDRIRYGSVIDFIDMHGEWGGIDHHWPTYNVADIAICVGVGLMAIDMFTSKRKPEAVKRPVVKGVEAAAGSDAGTATATATDADTATATDADTATATATATAGSDAGTGTATATDAAATESAVTETAEK